MNKQQVISTSYPSSGRIPPIIILSICILIGACSVIFEGYSELGFPPGLLILPLTCIGLIILNLSFTTYSIDETGIHRQSLVRKRTVTWANIQAVNHWNEYKNIDPRKSEAVIIDQWGQEVLWIPNTLERNFTSHVLNAARQRELPIQELDPATIQQRSHIVSFVTGS
jgi:hypothetical protein